MSNRVRLGDHTVKIGSGQTPSGGHNSYCAHGIPLIRSQNVLMGSFSTTGLVYISPQIDQDMAGSRVLPGDVLLNITGASIGRVCIVPDKYCPANVNQHVCIIRCKETLDPDYVAALLASPRFQDFIWGSQAGGTRQALTKQMIEGFEIPWRPIDHQRIIAAQLKTQLAEVESARKATQAQAKDISLLRSRLITETFAAIDTKPTPLGNVIRSIQAGKSFQTSEVLAKPSELGVLKVSAVSWSRFQPNEAKALKDDYEPEQQHRVCKDDFIISRANTRELVGAVVLVDESHPYRLLSDKTLRLVIDEQKACKAYLLYALRAPMARKHIEHFATGTSDSMRNISQGTITSIPIVLPELEAQIRIAKLLKKQLEEIDVMQKANKSTSDELAALPQRLLSQAFDHKEAT